MDTAAQAFRRLRVDAADAHQAAEGGLDVAARAAEAVIKVEVTEGGVEIVTPHQPDHAPAKPDAFRVAGRTVDRLRRFDEFVGLALVVLGGIARRGGGRGARIGGWRFALILGAQITALGESASDSKGQQQASCSYATHDGSFALDQQSTHEVPDYLWPSRSAITALDGLHWS